MRKRGLRISAPGKVLLLGLGLVIPGLLISIIGIGSASRQKQARAMQLRDQWQGQLERIAGGLEKSMDHSIQAVFTSLSREPFDPGRPLQIQQRLKNLLAANPVVTYPFMITANREYLFPFTRPMIAVPARFESDHFQLQRLRANSRQAETHEFRNRDWLAAIREFLAGEKLAVTQREKALFSLVIGRCYFKWGKVAQAIPYLRDVANNRGLSTDSDRFLSLEARQLLALAHDRKGDREAATDCYLGTL